MAHSIVRRHFLENAALHGTVAGLSLGAITAGAASVNEKKVTVGVMGLSRGRALADAFAKQSNVEVKYVCDIDTKRAEETARTVAGAVGKSPRPITDFRQILDDPEVDALVCAAPNHWHAPATILSCAAGTHVYVEKPCSHTLEESDLLAKAATETKLCVQHGTQRRGNSAVMDAIQFLNR